MGPFSKDSKIGHQAHESLPLGQAVGRLLGILGEDTSWILLAKAFESAEINVMWVPRAF